MTKKKKTANLNKNLTYQNINKDDDPVISEHSVILLPIYKKPHTAISFNRVQFQQKRYWLRSSNRTGSKYLVNYRQNVKQLRFEFLKNNSKFKESSVEKTIDLNKCDIYSGEGFPLHKYASYTLGFAKNDKIFFLPIDETYDMNWKIPNTQFESEGAESSNSSSLDNKLLYPSAPVRIRFARIETDTQKCRREQSALYKQKLIEQDPWITLNLQKKDITKIYEKEVDTIVISSEWNLHSH